MIALSKTFLPDSLTKLCQFSAWLDVTMKMKRFSMVVHTFGVDSIDSQAKVCLNGISCLDVKFIVGCECCDTIMITLWTSVLGRFNEYCATFSNPWWQPIEETRDINVILETAIRCHPTGNYHRIKMKAYITIHHYCSQIFTQKCLYQYYRG